MREQVHLLQSVPKIKRDVSARAATKNDLVVSIARQYGHEYFDGDRKYGYGGYIYDGRWLNVAIDICHHYKLTENMRVLDIGCAKGFLVKDLMVIRPGLQAFGLDCSDYALTNCVPEMIGRLHYGLAEDLSTFPDEAFDLVVSFNTLHNLEREELKQSLREIMRVTKGPAFVQVDSYNTSEEKAAFESWVLTAQFHDYPAGWLSLFEEAGYSGDYDFTFV